MEIEITLPLTQSPPWMHGLVVSRDSMGNVHFEVRKSSGEHYGIAILTVEDFDHMRNVLGLTQ